jgi:hypothetical protein
MRHGNAQGPFVGSKLDALRRRVLFTSSHISLSPLGVTRKRRVRKDSVTSRLCLSPLSLAILS